MDYAALSAELIAELRGQWSQQRLSKQLGYASNVVYLWERQRRLPDAEDLFRVAQLRRVDVASQLAAFVGEAALKLDVDLRQKPLSLPLLLRWMAGEHSAVSLAALTGFDRMTIGRWLAGRSSPRLPDFLRFLDFTTLRLLEFVALFAEPTQLGATSEAYSVAQAREQLAYTAPWSVAVLHALQLDSYRSAKRHQPQLLAKQLGLSIVNLELQLSQLAHAGLIEQDGGLWREVRVLSVDTRRDFRQNRQLKQHWAAVAAERLALHESNAQSLFSYNVFPIGQQDLLRLRELHLEYFGRVRQLVAAASGADHVVVMNLQLCLLAEPTDV